MRTANLKEWIGKTDDSRPPNYVRTRVFLAKGGICHIANRKIMPGELWDLDHVVALINGGENRESNLAPALRDKHREKTKADLAEKSKVYQKAAKNIGISFRKGPPIRSAGFPKRPPQRSASRQVERRT
jgi:5-methylcytosine-specific restriction protein A